jgi:hypothetical protein
MGVVEGSIGHVTSPPARRSSLSRVTAMVQALEVAQTSLLSAVVRGVGVSALIRLVRL